MKLRILIMTVMVFLWTINSSLGNNRSLYKAASDQTTLPDYLEAYMQLKDALHAGDASKTKITAADMKSRITKSVISDAKKLESINNTLSSMSSMNDIDTQRILFAKLSQYLISYLEDHPIAGITLYSDFCPMAREGKGAYWLSTEKMIMNNPYMGTSMTHCGSIDEKISK